MIRGSSSGGFKGSRVHSFPPYCVSPSLSSFLNCLVFLSPWSLGIPTIVTRRIDKWISMPPLQWQTTVQKASRMDVSSFSIKSTHTLLLLTTALFFLEYLCLPVAPTRVIHDEHLRRRIVCLVPPSFASYSPMD